MFSLEELQKQARLQALEEIGCDADPMLLMAVEDDILEELKKDHYAKT
jgi:hypothetical protein